MAAFIELTLGNGDKIAVNANYIVDYTQDGGFCTLQTIADPIEVVETYSDVTKLLHSISIPLHQIHP